jgi:hypothetical protein
MICLACSLLVCSVAASQNWNAEAAARSLAEAQQLCEKDSGRLWGVSLCGPLLIVDRESRRFVANQEPRSGVLPPGIAIANTAFDWNGAKWTMVMWPLPEDHIRRAALLMHESWHRVQDSLGLPMTGPNNAHLDTFDGRYWMQLEWQALQKALESQGEERLQAIADALAFRAERRARIPAAAASEGALEMHEGLANYTGCALSGEPARCAIEELRGGARQPSFVRGFAYASGPAYGVLLDQWTATWRQGLTPSSDLGALLQQAAGVKPSNAAAGEDAYASAALRAREQQRERERQERIAAFRARFIDGPVLILPLKSGISFDPRRQTPLEPTGNVYGYLEATEEWGSLKAEGGALVKADWSSVIVPAPVEGNHAAADPTGVTISGSGWTLQLKPAWKLAPGPRQGDWTVIRRAN